MPGPFREPWADDIELRLDPQVLRSNVAYDVGRGLGDVAAATIGLNLAVTIPAMLLRSSSSRVDELLNFLTILLAGFGFAVLIRALAATSARFERSAVNRLISAIEYRFPSVAGISRLAAVVLLSIGALALAHEWRSGMLSGPDAFAIVHWYVLVEAVSHPLKETVGGIVRLNGNNYTPLGLLWTLGLLYSLQHVAASFLLLQASYQFSSITSPRKWPLFARKGPRAACSAEGLDGGVREVVRIAHWSDLHITMPKATYAEGRHNGKDSFATLQSIVKRRDLDGADVLLVTGDITDNGTAAEWKRVFELLEEIQSAHRDLQVVLLPGNHDINIPHDGPRRLWYTEHPTRFTTRKLRLLRVMAALDLAQGDRAHVVINTEGRLVITSLRDYLDRCSKELNAYGRTGQLPRAQSGTRMDPEVIYNTIFPMCIEVAPNLVIIVVNSIGRSSNIVTNAFGRLESNTIEKLRYLQAYYRGRGVARCYALHHHLLDLGHIDGDSESLPSGSVRDDIQLGGMVLEEPEELLDFLKTEDPTAVFHGHRHVEGHARHGRAFVFAAASTSLGDERTGIGPGFRSYEVHAGHDGAFAITGGRKVVVQATTTRDRPTD